MQISKILSGNMANFESHEPKPVSRPKKRKKSKLKERVVVPGTIQHLIGTSSDSEDEVKELSSERQVDNLSKEGEPMKVEPKVES